MYGQTALAIDRSAPRLAATASTTVGGAPMKLPKHRSLYIAGDEADRLFEVESGAVMLYRILDDGRRQVVEIVFPGGICGLSAGALYESCCETLMPSVVRSFKKSDLDRSDALRTKIVGKLQAQIAHIHDHTVSLGRKTAEERICTLILRLRDLEAAKPHSDGSIALPMTRTEIADYLGLTLETVCRTLSDLNRRKLVEVGAKKNELKVPNLTRLRQVAHCDA